MLWLPYILCLPYIGTKIERKEEAKELGAQVHLHSLVVDRGVGLEHAQRVLADAKVT